ncbi:MAG: SRPBCC family protein [Chloroflexi bacterium]|nr:SRPBCC family protein [Chloroflexota bacterium]
MEKPHLPKRRSPVWRVVPTCREYVVKQRLAWNTNLLEARQTKDGPIGKGTTFHVRNKPSMGVSEGTAVVVHFEPNRRYVLQADMGRMRPTLTHLFESTDGATIVTRRVQFELPGMMRLLQPLVQSMARKRNASFLANLKRVLE